MARSKDAQANIDKSNLGDYPNGRIKDKTGSSDGTPVNEFIYGDIHELFAKAMRLYGITYNGLADNETNGYQLLESVIALASKNDYVLNLSRSGSNLSIPVKIGSLQNNESLICKAIIDKGSEGIIKSTLDTSQKSVSYVGDFKNGEYVRLINTASEVILTRLVDDSNLDTVNTEKGYLKPATGSETIDGILNNKGVTPEAFLEAFAEYVLGSTSDSFLASVSRNGIYPKEHFEIVSGLTSKDKYGTFSPFNVQSTTPVGSTVPVTGDIASAAVSLNSNGGEEYLLTLNQPMDNLNYQIRMSVESLSSNMDFDNGLQTIPWKKISPNSFKVLIEENEVNVQTIKIHVDIIQR